MCACQLAQLPLLTFLFGKFPSIHRRQSIHEFCIQNRFVACGLNHHGATTTDPANIHTDHVYSNDLGRLVCVWKRTR